MNTTLSRRAALSRIASVVALTLPATALAVVPVDPDAEIIALSAEVVRRAAEAESFQETRIDPFEEQFDRIARSPGRVTKASLNEAFAFSRECGREAAIDKLQDFDLVTDNLFKRLMAISATTQAGRAAKVRALLGHVLCSGWRGPGEELDWDREMARALLGEFAGMSAAELEAI